MSDSESFVAIIDTGRGNFRSVEKAIQRLDYPVRITRDPTLIRSAVKLILPGVGHFAEGMAALSQYGLIGPLNEEVLEKKKNILGICLGMQLMTRSSEEIVDRDSGPTAGLGWIEAETLGFSGRIAPSLKIPHMGWNGALPTQPHPLTQDLDETGGFYFAHSFFVRGLEEISVLMRTEYGISFISAFGKANIFGVQFHPEKSHRYGLRILKNFLSLP